MLHIKFGFDWPSGFRGEDLRNCGRTYDERRTDARSWPSYKLTLEPNGSGELKIGIPLHTPVLLYKSVVQGGIHYMVMFSRSWYCIASSR